MKRIRWDWFEHLGLLAYACSFCRRHGVRTASDPNEQAEIIVHSERRLGRYGFGLRTADFMNLNTLDSERSLDQEPTSEL